MTDLIESALSALPLLMPHRKVRYQRGSEVIWLYNATIARTAYIWVDNNDIRHVSEGRDYLVPPDDLVLGGVVVTPIEGDQIIDEGNRFTVMAEGDGEVFRYTERYHTLLRIHTKENDDE